MKLPVIPYRRGAHRIAGIALFRALINRCRAVPLGDEEKAALQNVVRHRFRENRYLVSQRLLSIAFKGGYEGLNLLDSSVRGDSQSLRKITTLIGLTPHNLKHQRHSNDAPVESKRPLPRQEPRPSILSRPRPQVSGIRHIPRLVTAHGIPFLRVKKPQPSSLGSYIRNRILRHQKKFDQRRAMEVQLPTASSEDEWDEILYEQFGEEVAEPAFESWGEELNESIAQLHKWLRAEAQQNTIMARRMREVVEKEAELAKLEENERWHKRQSNVPEPKSIEPKKDSKLCSS